MQKEKYIHAATKQTYAREHSCAGIDHQVGLLATVRDISAWTTADGLEEGKLLPPVLKSVVNRGRELGRLGGVVRVRAVGQGYGNRKVRSARSVPALRQTPLREWR